MIENNNLTPLMPVRVGGIILLLDLPNKKGYDFTGTEISCSDVFDVFFKQYDNSTPATLEFGSLDAQSVELMQDVFIKKDIINKQVQDRTSQAEMEINDGNQ